MRQLVIAVTAAIGALAVAPAIHAQSLLTPIPHGGGTPVATVVDPIGNQVFLADSPGNLIRIDGETATAGAIGSVRNSPALALNPKTRRLYRGGATVSVIDVDTLGERTLPLAGNFVQAALDALHDEIQFVDFDPARLVSIDGATEQTRSVALAGSRPTAIAVDPLARRAIVPMARNVGSSAPVNRIDLASGVATQLTFPQPSGSPNGAAVNPLTGYGYVTGSDNVDGVVFVFDAAGTPTQTVGPIDPFPTSLYMDVVGLRAWWASPTPTLGGLQTTGPATFLQPTVIGEPQSGLTFDATSRALYVQRDQGALLRRDDDGYSVDVAATAERGALAVNPITHRVYLHASGGTAVVDGTRDRVSTVAVGADPGAIALNRVTGQVAVLDAASATLKLIAPGATTAQSVAVGAARDVAIDSRDGSIHVALATGNAVAVLADDGALLRTVTLASPAHRIAVDGMRHRTFVASDDGTVNVFDAGGPVAALPGLATAPVALAVNEATGIAYVLGANALVALRRDYTTTSTPVGTTPVALAIDEAHARAFVSNAGSGDVTVIDLASGTRTSVQVGGTPDAIVVNPVTGRAYVSRRGQDRIVEITPGGATRLITLGNDAVVESLAVDPSTNTILAVDAVDARLHVIDGVGLAAHVVAMATTARRLVVDAARHRSYAVNTAGTVTVLDRDDQSPANPLATTISISGTTAPVPRVRLEPTSSYPAGSPAVPLLSVYYQVDRIDGRWTPATADGGAWTADLTGLAPGRHTVYAFAIDALSGTYTGPADRLSTRMPVVQTGRVAAQAFYYTPEDGLFANGFE